MDLFAVVGALCADSGEFEKGIRMRLQPFFDRMDRAFAACERFGNAITAADEEKARRDALMCDYVRRMEEL